MISGVVNVNREATISLAIRGANGQEQEIETVIDTGFTGFLTLPSSLIASLELVWRGREHAILADGAVHVFDVYAVTVIWDRQPRSVEVDAVDTTSLVGMALIHGHELRIQVIDGGIVTIAPLG